VSGCSAESFPPNHGEGVKNMKKLTERLHNSYYRAGAVAAGATTGVAVVPAKAFAAQDYSGVADGAEAEITAVIPVALAVLVLTIGIPMAIRLFKRISH
jgi:hypothetical protein